MQDERNPEQEEDVEGFRHRGLQDDDDVEAHRRFLNEEDGDEDEDEDEVEAHRRFAQTDDPGFKH